MKVYGYVRCSTDKQDLQRQMLLIRRHCEQNHYELIDFIGEKVSGAKENRSGLNDVFNLSKNDCDIVIISDLSRLSREDDILNVMSEVNAIRRNGMDLYILDTDTWIRKSDTVDGMQVMKLVFTAVGNADERRKIAERMKTGRYAKLVKNHYHTPILFFRIKPYIVILCRTYLQKTHIQCFHLIYPPLIEGHLGITFETVYLIIS